MPSKDVILRRTIQMAVAFTALFSAAPAFAGGSGETVAAFTQFLPYLLFGVSLLVFGAAFLIWRRSVAEIKAWRHNLQEVSRLQARLETFEMLLGSDPDGLFLWEADGSVRLYSSGALQAGAHAKDAYGGFVDSLSDVSQTALHDAVTTLRHSGTRFAFPLFCKDGRTLTGSGKPVGAVAALWVSDVSEAYQEICTLRDALKETVEDRDFLRVAVNSIPYPAWRGDLDGQLIWANEAYCRAVEAPSLEAAIAGNEELFDARAVSESTSQGESRRIRTVINGERLTFDLFAVANETGSVSLAVDVTEIDDARNEAVKQLAAQHAMFNLLKSPVAIFSPDRELEFFNQSFVDLWNLPEDWLNTCPHHSEVLEAMRASRRLPEQADFPTWKKKQLSHYTNLIDIQEEIWQLPNERTLRVVTQPRPQGGLFVLYEDLTKLLTLERTLNAFSRVQHETLNRLQEGIAVFGADGNMNLFNASLLRIWNLTEADLANRPHVEDLAPLYQALVPGLRGWDAIKARITGVDVSREMYVMQIPRNDGTVIDCRIVPLPEGGTMLTLTDVSDTVQVELALRERNDALETADRLKSEFITHISYQFRTPLNSIIGFAEILEHEFFGQLNDRQHEYTQGLLEASQHLLTLVNDVIDLATIEAGHMSLTRGETEVRYLLLSVRDLSRQRARESDMTLLFDCPADIGVIHADARRIKQVMFNLLSNAFRFSQPGDQVTLGANRCVGVDGREICQLWVQDKGAGIERGYQENMFKTFESRPLKGKEPGAGIGLSLVRRLVELHDGWVDVKSEIGQGTKVTCNLPQRVIHHALAAEPEVTLLQAIQARL